MSAPTTRIYEAHAETTRTFGRVLASVRQHHFVIDGPVQNGCPGEAPTPGELFLSAAAACGAEVVQVLAREAGFQRRCPVYGSLAVASGSVEVYHETEPC